MTPADVRVLAKFGLTEADLIGRGGESSVYALGSDRVLRLARSRNFRVLARARLKAFLDRIAGRFPFATPEILEIGPNEVWTIEKRLPGRPMLALLRELAGTGRETVLTNYADAAAVLGTIELPYVPYGHLIAANAVRASDWRSFVRQSLAGFLARNRARIGAEIGDPDGLFAEATAMIAALPDQPRKALVHGDYFPGNVLLADDRSVSAVIDFGVYAVAGDAQLDLATAYLTLEMNDECQPGDAQFVRAALVARHGEALLAALRCYRAWLAFSMADPAFGGSLYPRLYGWSVAQLRLLAEERLTA